MQHEVKCLACGRRRDVAEHAHTANPAGNAWKWLKTRCAGGECKIRQFVDGKPVHIGAASEGLYVRQDPSSPRRVTVSVALARELGECGRFGHDDSGRPIIEKVGPDEPGARRITRAGRGSNFSICSKEVYEKLETGRRYYVEPVPGKPGRFALVRIVCDFERILDAA